MKKLKTLYIAGATLAASVAPALADATDIGTQLQTAATTAITAAVALTGTLLVGAFALPVGFRVYAIARKAFGKAG